MTRFLNWVLAIFGTTPDGSHRVRFSSSERRAWLWVGPRLVLRWEWAPWSRFCHAYISREHGEMKVGLAFPPVALWFSVEHWPTLGKGPEREIGVHIHDWAIWWRVWSPSQSWSNTTPRWRDGNWHPARTFLGKWVYEETVIEERPVRIPMPEGEYPATAVLSHAVRGHRLNPFKHKQREVKINVPRGIPFSGKGENSWDCGEDGLFGMSCPARSIEEAIGKTVSSVLETRKRRGDPARWPVSPEAQR